LFKEKGHEKDGNITVNLTVNGSAVTRQSLQYQSLQKSIPLSSTKFIKFSATGKSSLNIPQVFQMIDPLNTLKNAAPVAIRVARDRNYQPPEIDVRDAL